MVGIRVVLWSLKVQFLCQFLWDGQGRKKMVKMQPSLSRILVSPSPCSLPSPVTMQKWLLISGNKPSQGIMQKLQVQPTQGWDMGQIWGKAGTNFKRLGL